MRSTLTLPLLVVVAPLSLFVAPPSAHSSGEVPVVRYATKREVCGASSADFTVQAPLTAAVSGTIAQVGSSAPPTPFSVAAKGTQRIAVKGNVLDCSSTQIASRTYRVTTVGAAPFDIVVAPSIVELGAKTTSGGGQNKATLTLLRATATCASGAIQGEVSVATGTEPPSPVLVVAKIDAHTAGTPLTIAPSSTKKAQINWHTTPTVCAAPASISVGIASPQQTITLAPVSVTFAVGG